MKSTTTRELKVTANHSAKTFTLRFYYEDGSIVKYRTIRLPKEEFDSCLYNTTGDWEQFLKSDDYYRV